MRITASVLGIIGAITMALRGFYMRSILNDPMTSGVRAYERATGGDTSAYDMFEVYSMMLLLLAALGAVGSILLLLRIGPPKALALLMLIAGAVPMLNLENAPYALPLALAGLLAFFARKKPA